MGPEIREIPVEVGCGEGDVITLTFSSMNLD